MTKKIILVSICILFTMGINAQNQIIADQIVAIVGNSPIFQSDIEGQYLQMQAQGYHSDGDIKCTIFEEMLSQKLLLNQAKIDSIEVNQSQVEQQLEMRIKFFIERLGSKEKLEEYFKKSIFDIKSELKEAIREQMITQRMQNNITEGAKITPSEVRAFYESLPPDSIPVIKSSIEYQQLMIYPPFSADALFAVKQRLLDLRKQITEGRNFASLARLYSQDPGSASNGGEIGFMSKGELDPAYAKAAFSLKPGSVSTIVESQFGYHIIQCIEKKEDKVNTRHILIRPKATETEIRAAYNKLDSILNLIKIDSLKFEAAVALFSDDKQSNMNAGLVVNQRTSSSKFELDQLSPADFYVIKSLQVGDLSQPFEGIDENNKQAFKIVKLKSRIIPHKATLNDDYQYLQDLAVEKQKDKIVKDWISQKQKTTIIRIENSFKQCQFKDSGWLQSKQ